MQTQPQCGEARGDRRLTASFRATPGFQNCGAYTTRAAAVINLSAGSARDMETRVPTVVTTMRWSIEVDARRDC
jgi:hypothetical protein